MEVGWNGDCLVEGSGGVTIVVGPQYCGPRLVDLTFTKKAPGVKSGHVAVVDADGNVMYRIERHHFTMRGRKLVLDPSDQPILLVQSEHKTSHSVFDVFKGNSSDSKDLLFKIRKASEGEVNVFLAANSQQYFCDFKVRGDINYEAVSVFRGDSTEIVAEMSEECKFSSEAKDDEAFGVAVSPNVDSCFIVALFAALHEVSSAKVAGADRDETQGGEDGSLIAAAATAGVVESVTGKLIDMVSEFIQS